jgi:uncharacterized repeat protein (TIGR03803 family)
LFIGSCQCKDIIDECVKKGMPPCFQLGTSKGYQRINIKDVCPAFLTVNIVGISKTMLSKFLLPAAFFCCLSTGLYSQSNDFALYGSYTQPVGGEGAVYAINPDGTDYQIIKAFPSNPDGQVPVGKLLLTNDGYVYGVCQGGGTGAGTIFKMKTDGTEFQVIHTFDASFVNPVGDLVLGNDDYLFGSTKAGGFNDGGRIYKVKTDGSGFTTVFEFGGTHLGNRVGLTVDTDGTIYGIASNANSHHAVFKLSADGASFNVLHEFPELSSGVLVNGEILLASNGYLYGTSRYNGVNEKGTLFRIKKDGTSFSTILDFPATLIESPEYNIVEIGGVIYGSAGSAATSSTFVFKVNLDGTGYSVVSNPGSSYGYASAALAATPDGNLIIVCRSSGPGVGVVSHLDLQTNVASIVGTFENYSWDAAVPVVLANGDIIGGRDYGYSSKNGCIYRMTSAGSLTVFKDFPQPEGSQPMGNIVQSGGFLYGLTQRGGAFGSGVVYRMKKDGSEYLVLDDIDKLIVSNGVSISFNGPLLGSDGILYGVNDLEANWVGSLYKVSTDGSTPYTEIYQFNPVAGEYPTGHLIEGSDGMLYGMTQNGGANGVGTIYKISKDGGNFQKLHDFESGTQPQGASLVEGADGYLVGMTQYGGANSFGILFRIKMDGSVYEKIKDFDASTGAAPIGGTLVKHTGGRLFGLASGGSGAGVVFSVAGDGTGYQVVYDLTPSMARNAVTIGVDGAIYGQTLFGTDLFRVNIDGTGYSTVPLLPSVRLDPVPLNANFLASSKLSQTITFELASAATAVDPPITLTATSDSDLPVTFTSSNEEVAMIQGNTLTIVGAGEVSITATQAGNIFYKASSLSRVLTITKAQQTITFEDLEPAIFGDDSFDLIATSSSGLPVTFTSSEPAVATINGATVTITGSGSTTITASQSGNATYDAAEAVEHLLIVNKAEQEITFGSLLSKKFSDDDFELEATASSDLAVVYESSDPAVATVTGSTVSIVGVGTTTIIANQPGNANFNAAAPAQQLLVINKGDQQISFLPLSEKTFGDDAFDLNATSSSELPVTFTSSEPAVATINGGTVTIIGSGSTTITASQPGNANYDPAEDIEQLLIVNKAEQEITFGSLSVKKFNDDDFDLEATASSGLAVVYESSDPDIATVTGSTVSIVGVGTTTISANQPGGANFNAALPVEQTLTIEKGDQQISFSPLVERTFGDEAFELSAISTSELAVTFTSSEVGVATINGSVVTISGGGTTSITASQEGNDLYNPAISVTQVLEVARATQVITFNTVTNKTLGDVPFAPGATSTSDLTVTYSTASDKITINGEMVTLVKAGRVTVTASQEGDNNYEPATQVEQSFCINPAKPVITAGAPGEQVDLTSSNDEGNQWFKEGEAIALATATMYTADHSGMYTVQTTIDDCASVMSESFNLIVTETKSRSEFGILIYPNPSSDHVMVDVKTDRPEGLVLEVFDVVGRLILSRTGSTNTAEQLDLSGCSPGMYRVVARSSSGRYSGSISKK